MVRRVAVIGAGSSGLVCTKVCVDEGLEPVCFESSEDIGGIWKFKESLESEQCSIYRSLVVNTSKEMMCFSDFPMPADYPNFPHNSELLQYFRLYADNFDLLRYIRFQTKVTSVTQRSDFSFSGQWDIVTVNKDQEEERHVFDAVMVCSGHYTKPTLPLSDFPGHATFSGRCLHSWEYRDAYAYRGKRVLVVGIGNSGGDIAVEISRSAEKTFLSSREGAWVVGRMSTRGHPLDMTAVTRFNNLLLTLLPRAVSNWAVERGLNQKYDHRLYGLQPRHRFFDRRPLVNCDLPGQLLEGRLILKPNLKAFKDVGVVFEDGTVEDKIDAVVFCTGYHRSFPFLPPMLFEGPRRELPLYKRLFPPLSQPTLAVMGIFQVHGAVMPVVEMQARWAVKVFTGLSHLPSEKEMLNIIETEKEKSSKSYPSEPLPALQLKYIPYLDFMAAEVGVRPNLLRLLLLDPVLWMKVVFGPCNPYQYRLFGPGRWAGARQAIVTQWERVAQPFRTRVVPDPDTKTTTFLLFSCLLVFVGTVIGAVLLSKNEVVPGLQSAGQILGRYKQIWKDSWFPG